MSGHVRRAIRELMGPGFKDYDKLVTLIEDQADLLPNENTARDVYRDCRVMESVLRSEIAQKGVCDRSGQMVGALERQERVTARVKDYAKQKGWDLSPIDREPLYLQDERRK